MIRVKEMNFWVLGLLIFIGFHLYILSQLIFFPYPELFIYSYLTDQGLLPYKQILDQHFPGLVFFPINLHTLGMSTPQVARLWHFGVVVVTHILLFLVGKKLFKSEKWALFTNFLYLIWQPFFEGYVLWIDTFIPLFLLPSFYFFYNYFAKESRWDLFWSGLFLGLSLLFKQVAGPGILVAGFLVWWKRKRIEEIYPFLAGVLLPVTFLLVYIFSIGVLQDFFYWTVTFNLTTFAQMGRKYPDFSGLVRALPVYGLAGFTSVYYYFKRKSVNLLLLGAFFLASLAYAYARFDFIHLQPALPFALLIITSLFREVPKRYLLPIYLSFIFVSFFLLTTFFRLNMRDETLFFGDFEREISSKVSELAQPGDSVFAFGTTPHLYQLTNTLPPGNVFVFQFPWFMRVAEPRVLSGIINDPPKVVVRDREATVGGQSLIKFMPKIESHIERYFKVIEKINGTEIMVKNE